MNKNVNRETLESIYESIKRFYESLVDHQSYFWDDHMFEYNENENELKEQEYVKESKFQPLTP